TATQEQIKTAYRELARKWHPDRHPEPEDNRRATEKFQEINRAYETLKSPLERRRYDQFGHETWASSSETQTRDFYSEAFTDVFNRTDNVSSRPISQKSVYLFKKLILLINSKAANERDFTLLDALLRRLLAEFKITGLNKQTRERIIQGTALQAQALKDIIGQNQIKLQQAVMDQDSIEERFKPFLRQFITEVENRYLVEEITSKERQAIELFYQFSFFNQNLNDFFAKQKRKLELLQKGQEEQLTKEEKQELDRFQKEERKDLRVFRKILSSLALPGQTHHEFLLRSYLDAFKNSLFNEKFGEKLLTVNTHLAQQRFYMEDREIIKALKKVKTSFDNIHYENLRSMSNPFRLNFLKSFPVQFIIFQAAIGASLYRQSITDPYFYGAERNPELLSETMKHTLTPTGVASFFIFVAVSQQMSYRLYGVGRWFDGKSLGGVSFNGKVGRTIAPGAGLGLGFFVSVLFDELIHDPHLVKCAKSLYKEAPDELLRSHISPCESFYNNWSRSEKWMHYGVDIVTLIGSGVLSHKFLTSILNGIRLTAVGSRLLIGLTRTVGLRITGLAGFFAHMFFFMEFHKHLDVWIGQPLKKQLSAGSVKNSLVELTEHLNQDLNTISSSGAYLHNNLGGELGEYLSEQFKKATAGIKALGVKFQGWANIAGQTYNQSAGLWMQNINKLLLPYEASTLLLKNLFISAQFVYNSDISMAQNWDSQQEVTEDNRESWYRLNRGSWFDSRIIEFNKESYQEKYCPQVSEELPFWNNFCSHSEGFFGSEEFSEEFNGYLFRETAELIYKHLKSISLEKSYEINPIHYVGLGEDELFSSDPQYSLKELNYEIVKYPNQEIKRLSYDKEFELSRRLIKAGLDWESSLLSLGADQISELKSSLCAGYFPDYKTNPESEELYLYCYNSSSYLTEIRDLCHSWYPDDPEVYEQCIEFFHSTERELQWNFGLKLLSAGIYLLKDIIFKLDERGPVEISFLDGNPVIGDIWIFQPIFDLLESMKVYKKGEQKFLQAQENFVRQKNQLETDQEKDMLETQF
ncbi:MAG: DnaJ domain-containing protein, partial [Oligoflexia bacterium]|nr:DnaJ domain-containing protein [Oligoflexia bacterium]